MREAGYDEVADQFTLDSGSELSKGGAPDALKAGRKIRITDPKFWKKWGKNRNKYMAEMLRYKFLQCEEARKVLLLTKKAKLLSLFI